MSRFMFASWLLLVLTALGLARQGDKSDARSKPKIDDALRAELQRMVTTDQEARQEAIKAGPGDSPAVRKVADIDRKNTARMKEIIEKHGWPGKGLVGHDGAHAAWLLVQHADRDRAFQKRCLAFLERAVKANDASAVDLAYLTDRVLVGENKKQIYGTQFLLKEGKMEPYPIEDEKDVDRRRKEAGLSSMDEYRKTLEKVYKPRTKKSDE